MGGFAFILNASSLLNNSKFFLLWCKAFGSQVVFLFIYPVTTQPTGIYPPAAVSIDYTIAPLLPSGAAFGHDNSRVNIHHGMLWNY